MQEEITNIRKQFASLLMAMRDLYQKNVLDLPKAMTIKNFVQKTENLKKEFEEKIVKQIKDESDLNSKAVPIKGKAADPERKKFTNSGRIILISKKGNRLDGEHQCDECKMVRKPVYRYSESNVGPVVICNECKIKVFNRSFEPAGPKGEDLIGNRIKSGGGWETNRRKH